MAKCHICSNNIPGARQGTRFCDNCRAQRAIDDLISRASMRAANLLVNGTITRMQTIGEQLSNGTNMSQIARGLGISRSRLYDFTDRYNLKDYMSVCQAIGKGQGLLELKEMEITRKELLASAIKCVIEGDLDGRDEDVREDAEARD